MRKSEKDLELGTRWVQVRRITPRKLTCSADSLPDVSMWNGYGRISQSCLLSFHHLFFTLCTIVNTLTLMDLRFESANKCINNKQVKLPWAGVAQRRGCLRAEHQTFEFLHWVDFTLLHIQTFSGAHSCLYRMAVVAAWRWRQPPSIAKIEVMCGA